MPTIKQGKELLDKHQVHCTDQEVAQLLDLFQSWARLEMQELKNKIDDG